MKIKVLSVYADGTQELCDAVVPDAYFVSPKDGTNSAESEEKNSAGSN